jgi:hypothetical protein
MVKCSVFFAVRTEFLNIIWTSFGFKVLLACDMYYTEDSGSRELAIPRRIFNAHSGSRKRSREEIRKQGLLKESIGINILSLW